MDHPMSAHDRLGTHPRPLPQANRNHMQPPSVPAISGPLAPRYPHHHQHQHQHHSQSTGSYYPDQHPRIDVDALAASVQRYIPSAQGRASVPYSAAHSHANNSYIALPPGVDPSTVDFRTFFPYNPSEVKHRKRTTRPQLKVLEETFKRETKPNAALRKSLAGQLEMTPRGVQVWFQNRRAKEKTLAKKATSSSARKPISLGLHFQDGAGDADNDVDCDEDPAEDISSRNSESAAQTARSAPRMGNGNDRPSLEHSNSSSNSPESTSPEATPPTLPVDPPATLGPKPNRIGSLAHFVARPTALDEPHPNVRLQLGWSDGDPSSGPVPPPPITPNTSRHGASHMRSGYPGRARGVCMNIGAGGVGSGRFGGFDPSTRRMSLDRLGSHPYAHVAAQANGVAMYGQRFHPTLPATAHSTPTLTPQAHTSELPSIQPHQIDGNNSSNDSSPSALPELLLPSHLQHPPISPPTTDMRSELMHRQSLPAQFAQPPHLPSTPNYAHAQLPGAGMQTRFPRPGHVFALSARSYQPPIPGPLPNPDFSFGSPRLAGNEEGENVFTDGNTSCSSTPGGQLPSYQFPSLEAGKDDSENMGMDLDMDADATTGLRGLGTRPSVYFRDVHGVHGADPYASRFGSIASIASIAESESSASYFSETGSYDVQHDGSGSATLPTGFNDTRRPSCTGQIVDMFSELGVHNGSTNSLPHPQELPKTIIVPISSGSSSSDGASFNQSHRSSMSSSEFSLPYPLSLPASAVSSRSSLGLSMPRPPVLPRLDTDKLDFIHNYDAVSETGHYSPVSHPGSAAFEFPPSNASQGHLPVPTNEGLAHGVRREGQSEGGMTPHPFNDEVLHSPLPPSQFPSMYSCTEPYGKDGSYQNPSHTSGHDGMTFAMHVNAPENGTPYGYFN
ncbi:hypothetical protein DFH11DRAFT_1539988 [Phellopilus nigrolimitatus]|nr:hypothetical protein DFH11DRAFT_1539988 [Phellopilus nigrolimitatus]